MYNLLRLPALSNTHRGDWGEIQYCHERISTDTSKSKARPITGFRCGPWLRAECLVGRLAGCLAGWLPGWLAAAHLFARCLAI